MNNNNIIIDKVLDIPLKNEIGDFYMGAYKVINKSNTTEEIILLYCGDIHNIKNVRINSACYSSDIFHCNRCDCHDQLEHAMQYFHKEKNGLIIYLLDHDGRGCGTVNKLKSLQLMDVEGKSTKEAFDSLNLPSDNRDYSAAVTILKDLNINDINLITNNPEKLDYLTNAGIRVNKRIPSIHIRNETISYLLTKQRDFHHWIEV